MNEKTLVREPETRKGGKREGRQEDRKRNAKSVFVSDLRGPLRTMRLGSYLFDRKFSGLNFSTSARYLAISSLIRLSLHPRCCCAIPVAASIAFNPQVEFNPTIVRRSKQSDSVWANSCLKAKTTSAAIAPVSKSKASAIEAFSGRDRNHTRAVPLMRNKRLLVDAVKPDSCLNGYEGCEIIVPVPAKAPEVLSISESAARIA